MQDSGRATTVKYDGRVRFPASSVAFDGLCGRIAIVGTSLAGLRAAETLRREGFDGRIVAIGAEPHLPYDRPPLSKELLARRLRSPTEIVLRKQGVDDLDLDWRLGEPRGRARRRRARASSSHDGERVAFDGLVHRDRRRRRAGCRTSPTSPACSRCARSTTRSRCATRLDARCRRSS